MKLNDRVLATRSMALIMLFTACLLLGGMLAARANAAGCNTASERAAVDGWFQRYKTAWEQQDTAASAALFTPGATYQETPFATPMRGEKAILAYWNRMARGQRDVQMGFEVLSACGNTGIVHWTARFVRVPSGQEVRLDGIAEITFDREGKGALFLEWWNAAQK